MGAGQSSQSIDPTTPQASKNIERVELFSVIFMRLLKNTDILDIRALTKGPGACGDYIVLLSKELNKEFGIAKLNASHNGTSAGIQDFLYARSKVVTNASPTDEAACNSLAIFYMRALQFVAALTLSIYTPPDLVSRIRNQVFQTALKKQQKDRALTPEEQAKQKQKREEWFRKTFLSPAPATKDVLTFAGRPSLKYYPFLHQIVYTSEADLNEYRAKIAIKEPTDYNIEEALVKPDVYWIEVSQMTSDAVIFRALASPDKSAYIYETKRPATNVVEKWILPSANCVDDLIEQLLANVTPVQTKKANNTRRHNWFGEGGRKRRTRRHRGGQQVTTPNVPKVNTSMNLSPQTQLPRAFQESYKSMVRWSSNFAKWSEAAPASYRAVLLYIQPTLPASAASTYLCVDNWSDKPLRDVPPFAALEALYYERDDGTASPENQSKLANLAAELNSIYNTGSTNPAIRDFMDVRTTPVNQALRNGFCGKRTAQGDVLVDAKFAAILQKAQTAILEEYREHFEQAYALIGKIFVTVKNPSGQSIIKFSDEFSKSSKGARAQLEEAVTLARGLIAHHYVTIEQIYATAMKDIVAATSV